MIFPDKICKNRTGITFTFNKLQCDRVLIHNIFYNNVLNSNLNCMIMNSMPCIF